MLLDPCDAIFKTGIAPIITIRICHNNDHNDNNKEIDIHTARIIILISQTSIKFTLDYHHDQRVSVAIHLPSLPHIISRIKILQCKNEV